jgi:hypothetical protein
MILLENDLALGGNLERSDEGRSEMGTNRKPRSEAITSHR